MQISAQLTKGFMDTVKRGDVEAVKAEQEKLGINVAYLVEDNYRHNAIYNAALVKDEQAALHMVEYLLA